MKQATGRGIVAWGCGAGTSGTTTGAATATGVGAGAAGEGGEGSGGDGVGGATRRSSRRGSSRPAAAQTRHSDLAVGRGAPQRGQAGPSLDAGGAGAGDKAFAVATAAAPTIMSVEVAPDSGEGGSGALGGSATGTASGSVVVEGGSGSTGGGGTSYPEGPGAGGDGGSGVDGNASSSTVGGEGGDSRGGGGNVKGAASGSVSGVLTTGVMTSSPGPAYIAPVSGADPIMSGEVGASDQGSVPPAA